MLTYTRFDLKVYESEFEINMDLNVILRFGLNTIKSRKLEGREIWDS